MSLLDMVPSAGHAKKAKKVKAKPETERPVPVGGDLPTGPSMERYARATVKQISLQFDGVEYREVIVRLRRVLEAGPFDTHYAAFMAMLTLWEKEHGLDKAAE